MKAPSPKQHYTQQACPWVTLLVHQTLIDKKQILRTCDTEKTKLSCCSLCRKPITKLLSYEVTKE